MSDNEHYKLDKQIAEGTARDNLRIRSMYSHGASNDLPLFYRFVIIETIFDPTVIDEARVSYFEHSLGVSNIQYATVLPRNAVVARRVMDSQSSAAEPPMFLFPFFPPAMSFPCQPGQHVWVMFESPSSKKNDVGYWFCRIVEPGFVEDVNHTHPPRANDASFVSTTKDLFDGTSDPKYEFRNGVGDTREGQRYTIAETATLPGGEDAYEKILTESDGAKLHSYEAVPRFRKRPGDIVLEGSNNSLIVLGRDRTGSAASFKIDNVKGKVVDGSPAGDQLTAAGSVDIVVGRGQTASTLGKEVTNSLQRKEIGKSLQELVESEGDPDFANDRSRIYVAQKTQVDKNFQLELFNQEMGSGKIQGQASTGGKEKNLVIDSASGDGAIVVKADKVRLIARADLEIIVTGQLERDAQGRIVGSTNTDDFAAFIIKSNGDVVVRPSKKGFIKLGGDDADKALVCSDAPVSSVDGVVVGDPLITTMGGFFAGSKPNGQNQNGPALSPGQAKFSAKVLVK